VNRSPCRLGSLLTCAALALVACASDPDADRDGLTESQEVALGTDPLNPDTDGDGLFDGAEAWYDADPLAADTDDDGYTDRDEVHEGHDPADPDDRIYTGGWPYLFDKSVIPRTAGGYRSIGATFHRLRLTDQHGDEVDLYDFYNSDKPVVIDVSAEDCTPCLTLSGWLSGVANDPVWSRAWPDGPEAVERGEVHWLTLLELDIDGQPATPDSVQRWKEAFPLEQSPVLADPAGLAGEYTGLTGWPSLYLLEPDLTLAEANRGDIGEAGQVLEELARRHP
jgi:hypothetical protein